VSGQLARGTCVVASCVLLLGCGEVTPTSPPASAIPTAQAANNSGISSEVPGTPPAPPPENAVPKDLPNDRPSATDAPSTPSSTKTIRRVPHRRGPQGTRECTFDDIKFEMEKGDPFERSMITDNISALVGTKIRIRGYILPSFQQTGLTKFVLVRDNMECCFGPGAALYDCIVVDMEPGKTTEFSIRPVAVEGVFSIRELKGPGPNANHLAIYHLQADKVK